MPIKFKLINYKNVFREVKIEPNGSHIIEYLNGDRQDILENFDIFCENVRSKCKTLKNFELFQKVEEVDSDCIIVIGLYLELLEFWGQRNKIYDLANFYCNKYKNNKVVVTWNHDIDAQNVFDFIDKFENLYVLNFNTSVNHKRFIVLPFWTIDESCNVKFKKKYLGNLVCTLNNNLRYELKQTIQNNNNFFTSERVDYNYYKELLNSSKFTFCPRGIGLSSYRFFECFNFNTIPVLIADDVILPFENELNYDDFILRIPENKINDLQYIINKLKNSDYDLLLNNINKVKHKFSLKGVQEEIYNKLK